MMQQRFFGLQLDAVGNVGGVDSNMADLACASKIGYRLWSK